MQGWRPIIFIVFFKQCLVENIRGKFQKNSLISEESPLVIKLVLTTALLIIFNRTDDLTNQRKLLPLSLGLITLFCNFYSTRFCLCVCVCMRVCLYVCGSSRPFIIYYRLCMLAPDSS